MQEERTYFGFKRVTAQEKVARVQRVFSSVASRYDLMNTLMSGGLHYYWKHEMLGELGAGRLLDMASGTGDIASGAYKAEQRRGHTPDIWCADMNADMLAKGRDKHINQNYLAGMHYVVCDAATLPFPEQSFDYYSIAFGLRNVTQMQEALVEAKRVLRPHGKLVILEFSKVTGPLLARLYDTYSFHVIPWLGEMVAGDAASYQYLVESIRQFPSQHQLCQMLRDAGFINVAFRNLSGGIVAIHTAWRGT
jgi:demethylmenaquinone methyltransferase/2-methoxy-6-polyprenyl-1,4-benzoquinol methylase